MLLQGVENRPFVDYAIDTPTIFPPLVGFWARANLIWLWFCRGLTPLVPVSCRASLSRFAGLLLELFFRFPAFLPLPCFASFDRFLPWKLTVPFGFCLRFVPLRAKNSPPPPLSKVLVGRSRSSPELRCLLVSDFLPALFHVQALSDPPFSPPRSVQDILKKLCVEVDFFLFFVITLLTCSSGTQVFPFTGAERFVAKILLLFSHDFFSFARTGS